MRAEKSCRNAAEELERLAEANDPTGDIDAYHARINDAMYLLNIRAVAGAAKFQWSGKQDYIDSLDESDPERSPLEADLEVTASRCAALDAIVAQTQAGRQATPSPQIAAAFSVNDSTSSEGGAPANNPTPPTGDAPTNDPAPPEGGAQTDDATLRDATRAILSHWGLFQRVTGSVESQINTALEDVGPLGQWIKNNATPKESILEALVDWVPAIAQDPLPGAFAVPPPLKNIDGKLWLNTEVTLPKPLGWDQAPTMTLGAEPLFKNYGNNIQNVTLDAITGKIDLNQAIPNGAKIGLGFNIFNKPNFHLWLGGEVGVQDGQKPDFDWGLGWGWKR